MRNDFILQYDQPGFTDKLARLRSRILEGAYWPQGDPRYLSLREIIAAVIERGDQALVEFTSKFDHIELTSDQFKVMPEAMQKAHEQLDGKLVSTIKRSIENVRKYQQEIFNGNSIPGKVRYTPVSRAGLCIPGASAPLPSTVIMTAVPAQAAGVKKLTLVSPPRFEGSIHPVILAVCHELGITDVYRIGGAHAVAAMAYGTETIERVQKIVGPGNQWVQLAKREVFGQVDIDSIAGPSEVLILAGEKARPDWVAADMLSQAEHAPGSAIVFTDSPRLAENILKNLEQQVQRLSRSGETLQCLDDFSGIVVFENIDQVIEHANDFASEHLQIQYGDQSEAIAERIENAGAIFIGEHTPVATGDYFAGPSHTLPTGMSAKFFSPLSCNDFVKSSSLICYSREKLLEDAENIIRLAECEGLDAHANSVRIRTQS